MARTDLSHLVPVRIVGVFPVMSVMGYRDVPEVQWDQQKGVPLTHPVTGDPVVINVEVPIEVEVQPGGIAWLDPEKTRIREQQLGGQSVPISLKEAGPHPSTFEETASGLAVAKPRGK